MYNLLSKSPPELIFYIKDSVQLERYGGTRGEKISVVAVGLTSELTENF